MGFNSGFKGLKYFNFLQSDITLTMSPIHIYSSAIKASLYSERIPKKTQIRIHGLWW